MDEQEQPQSTPAVGSLSFGTSSVPSSSAAEMTPEERFQLVRSIGEECSQEDELWNLLAQKPNPICYDGFEPSERMHIAQGIMKTINVNKLTKAGCTVKIWISDWFQQFNNKTGGDLTKIRTFGRYMINIWKALGMNQENVEFLWSSDEINSRASEYWPLVMDIARKTSVACIEGCTQIMGQNNPDKLTAAQIFYPCMQCADIFFLKADICQLGMDQREINMLAREYCDDIKRKNKPIILSHQGQEKMSKSDSTSSIYMEDAEEEVATKIKKAFCPPRIVEGNPCLEYIKYIVLPWSGKFEVTGKENNGGDKIFTTMEELIVDYERGNLHPADLKRALTKAINDILQPVRDHFKSDNAARDLLKIVKAYRVNRKVSSGIKLKLSTFASQSIPTVDSSAASSSSTPEMTAEEKFLLVRSIGEECIQEDELWKLLAKKPNPICYDGFEPSGRMHIAQGIMKTINVNKLTQAGCTVKIWIADWFAQLNNKMGGDLKKIQTIGRYLIEIWKAVGMNQENVELLWSSDEINGRASEYWPLVMDIARRNSLARIKRCSQIMGRNGNELTAAQILYPCMQCADIFFLKADICQLGMDQRKVNALAREYCNDIKRKNKPIILSHHMLPGLKEGQEKMSKSKPESSIYMEDEEMDVKDKIEKAYCPPRIVKGNPCLEYIQYIVFPWFGKFEVTTEENDGGDKVFTTMEELIVDYVSGTLRPHDLKKALTKAINDILEPVRNHFKNDSAARDLLKIVKAYKVSR